MRISLNIPSIKKESVKYGNVISLKNNLLSTDSIFTKFYYDFDNRRELESHFSLTFMTGSVSVGSKIIILNKNKRIKPGDYAYAVFKLQDRISTMSKERFIVRDTGEGRTIGGGIIVDPYMDHRYNESLNDVYGGMISDDPQNIVYSFIKLAVNADLEKIYKKLNYDRANFKLYINNLARDGKIIMDSKEIFAILKEDFHSNKSVILKIIKERATNEKNTLKKGIGKQELYNIFENNFCRHSEILFEIIIDDLLLKKEILNDNGNIIIKQAGLEPADLDIPEEYIKIIEKIESFLSLNGNSVPTFDEIVKKIKINKKMLNYAISIMVKQGKLVKIKYDIYYLKGQIDNIKKGLDLFFASSDRLEPIDMKNITAVSRKYAIPLLEYFDHVGYTIKVGNYRIKK